MKRAEKNALSRQRIIDAAMREFSSKGYSGASLNTVCAEHGFSKGIIYHYFKDKDELYLLCVRKCFDKLTEHIRNLQNCFSGAPEQKLRAYFDGRLRFFMENPILLGIFSDAAFNPPRELESQILTCRREFDELNISVFTKLLNDGHVRKGLSIPAIVDDFRSYTDFFNMRFRDALSGNGSPELVLKNHEEKCHRQLEILLYGVLGEKNE